MHHFRRLLRHFFTLLGITATLSVGILLFLNPETATSGASAGIFRCTELLLPALFPFLVFSSFLIHSGLAETLGRPLRFLMLRVFRLPSGAATTLLTGLTGGYPVGARGIRTLWESGILNTEQAKRMLLFCVGAGPGFLVSVVGERLLHSRTAGLLLFVAQILSALLLGIFLARFAPLPDVSSRTKTPHSASLPFSEAMVHAVSDAARSMLSLCSFVVFFSAMFPLAESSGILSALRRILCTIGLPAGIAASVVPVFWEVSGAVQNVCEAVPFSAALLGFAVGFGGLCTQFQIFSAAGAIPFSHRLFFLFRLLHGLLTAGFTALFFSRLPEHSLPVFSGNSAPAIQARSTSFPLMSALLVLCFVFLLVIPQNSAENPRICPRNAHRIS